jgi:aryl-alcohol dehydrogenase-like predicted oxidoreductase
LAKESQGRRAGADIQRRIEAMRPQLEAWEALCRDLGERPADTALAWLLTNPVVTAPIIGPRTIEQLDESLRALAIHFSDETLKRLDEIFPGPGNQAPEAYAW